MAKNNLLSINRSSLHSLNYSLPKRVCGMAKWPRDLRLWYWMSRRMAWKHSKITEIMTSRLLGKCSAFVSRIRRSSNMLKFFPCQDLFLDTSVFSGVLGEKPKFLGESSWAYTNATIAWPFGLLGQVSIREREKWNPEMERGIKREGTHPNTETGQICIWHFISV